MFSAILCRYKRAIVNLETHINKSQQKQQQDIIFVQD